MIYDCLIIGGGLAGLTCGIKCAREGLKTVIMSSGMSALHFSSGSIDLMGINNRNRHVKQPYDYIKKFSAKNPDHPYAKTGQNTIKKAISFFQEEASRANLEFYHNGNRNHSRITALGVLRPTYLSQVSVYNERLKQAIEEKQKIKILSFRGFRDYFANLTIEHIKENQLLKDIDISLGHIKLPYYTDTEKNQHEFRSIDIARIFNSQKYLPRIADEIKKAAGDTKVVSLPAFIGIENYNTIHKRLEEKTGLIICEIPTLPPSILGMRLDNALKERFAELGGAFSIGDTVTGGEIKNGRIDHIHTKNYGTTRHHARFFVLSTGSFFSGGLVSSFNQLQEPVFNLSITGSNKRDTWYSDDFFSKKGHPFLSFGVKTNKAFNPYNQNNKVIKNMFCAGAILAGYDPVKEGSGGGVAITTGYAAAQRIIKECKKK